MKLNDEQKLVVSKNLFDSNLLKLDPIKVKDSSQSKDEIKEAT